MNSFERQAFLPPPIQPFVVLGRHGSKLKVRIFGKTKIMTFEDATKWAHDRKAAGAAVQTNGLIKLDETAVTWPTYAPSK